MATFVDRHGRNWECTITVSTLSKLKAIGVNLLSPTWAGDVELFGRLLWTLCESQATAQSVDEDQFADGFDGPALSRASDAIDEEYTVFSLRRPALAAAARAGIPQMRERMEHDAIAKISQIISTWNNTAGNLPEPSALTPDK